MVSWWLLLIIIIISLVILFIKWKKSHLTIVTAHHKENLDWLKKSKRDVVVCDKAGADPINFDSNPKCSMEINRGREASSYLKYIIEHYDSLPNYVAFIHGHEEAWHQSGNILDIINRARKEKYTYISLNNRIDLKCENFPDELHAGETGDLGTRHPAFRLLMKKWDTIFEPILKIPKPNYFRFKCCAQFIVSRETILTHTKEEYQKLYDFAIDPSESDFVTGMALEFIWHILFGEHYDTCKTDPNDPLHKDCNSKTYASTRFRSPS